MVVAVTLQLFTFTFSLFAATNSFTVANGGAWETGTSVVYPISEGYTGGSVVFAVAGAFELGANAKFDATAAGFRRYDGRSPVTYAPGFGYSYTIGAGYGGYGCRDWTYEAASEYGRPYGFKFAPIHPGSPKGTYDSGGDGSAGRGGGLIRIHAGAVTIDGMMDASARSDTTSSSSSSGGGIWVTSRGDLSVGAGAKFFARGGYKVIGTGLGGGAGGRIALACRLSDIERDQLAASGIITGSRPANRRYQDYTSFTNRYPGATADLSYGGGGGGDDRCFGTFGFIVPPPGLAIICR